MTWMIPPLCGASGNPQDLAEPLVEWEENPISPRGVSDVPPEGDRQENTHSIPRYRAKKAHQMARPGSRFFHIDRVRRYLT